MTIFDYFKASVIAVYYNQRMEDREPFLGEYFFPNDKQIGLTLEWIKGANSTPVMLNISNFDADPTYRDFGGFETQSTNMPLWREGYLLKEKDRQLLLQVMSSQNFSVVETLISKIYNEIADLVESASVSREVLRWQLLQTGKIVLNSNGVALNYDYSLNAKQKVKPTVAWTTFATSTPFEDLEQWASETETRTGTRPSLAIMTTNTFNLIKKSASVKTLFKDYGLGVPSKERITDYISTELKLSVVIYDKKYAKKKGATATNYLADNTVILTPDVALGKTMFGTTPEEADLLYSNVANVDIVDTGVAITSVTHTTPVKIETIVSQVCLPTFEGADLITIATVNTSASA